MKKLSIIFAVLFTTSAAADDYIGNLSTNQFDPDGVNNSFSKWNNEFYPDSPKNEFGLYGSQFSPYSSKNSFSPYAPRVYGGPFDEEAE